VFHQVVPDETEIIINTVLEVIRDHYPQVL